MITVVAIGKKHEDWVMTGIERYQKRLRRPFDIEWRLLPHSSMSADVARKEESARILERLSTDSFVILLDERGRTIDSIEFSETIQKLVSRHPEISIVIGGAYGVSDALQNRSNLTISLSQLVFPHQLVRLLLIEQLYRAQSIADNGKYHHI